MMAGIRSKNTKPELVLRKALHRRGFRYVLHSKTLPGRPDVVMPARKAVLFVHGCFWHGHGCRYFRWPASRRKFWKAKIVENTRRDERARGALLEAGWRVGVVYECAVTKSGPNGLDAVVAEFANWLEGNVRSIIIPSVSAETESLKAARRPYSN